MTSTANSLKWRDQEVDQLLELWLVKCAGYKTIQETLNRSLDSIKTKLWKVAVAYDHNERNYLPSNRTDRQGQEWTTRDEFLYKAWSEAERPCGVTHIAKVLMRPPSDINKVKVPHYGRKGLFDE